MIPILERGVKLMAYSPATTLIATFHDSEFFVNDEYVSFCE